MKSLFEMRKTFDIPQKTVTRLITNRTRNSPLWSSYCKTSLKVIRNVSKSTRSLVSNTDPAYNRCDAFCLLHIMLYCGALCSTQYWVYYKTSSIFYYIWKNIKANRQLIIIFFCLFIVFVKVCFERCLISIEYKS